MAPLVMNPHGLEDFKVRDPLKRLAYAPFRAMYARGAQAADRVIATDESLRGEVARFLRVPPRARRACCRTAWTRRAARRSCRAERQAALRARLAWPGRSLRRAERGAAGGEQGAAVSAAGAGGAGPGARPWRWVIVGAGQDRAALEALAAELGLAERVVFAGAVDDADLHNLYALADGFRHSEPVRG